MKYWLVNHNWVSFSRTKEYCGFVREWEQKQVSVEDRLVYYGDGFVLGLFEATALVKNEFKGWQKPYPFQIRIRPLVIPNNPIKDGIKADWLKAKILLSRKKGSSPNIIPISEKEFIEICDKIPHLD